MNYDEVFHKIILKPPKDKDNQKYLVTQTIVHHSTYQGYNRLTDPLNIGGKMISLVPDKKLVTLEDAIEDATDNVVKNINGRDVYLLLSGGIDSTLVFYALVKRGIPLTVVSDQCAVMEYMRLYKQILHHEFKDVSFYPSLKNSFAELAKDKNILLVTGEIGDQTMGTMVNMELTYKERNTTMTDAVKIDLLHKICIGEFKGNFTQACIATYGDVITWLEKTPDNCTVAEFLWAVNFIYKYLLVIYRLYMCGMVQYGEGKNVVHFFDTEKFQQYAMSHYEENCAYVEDYEYKQAFKDWIYTQNGDEEFRKYKLKVPSLRLSNYWRERVRLDV